MESLWERVKKNLVEWYDVAYDKTDELARIGKKKIEIAGLNRTIEKQLSELGGRVYDMILMQDRGSEVAGDEVVVKLIEGIKALEKQLKGKEEEIQKIREVKKKGREQEAKKK